MQYQVDTFRLSKNNLLTKAQVESILETIGERHRDVLSKSNHKKTLKEASRKSGLSINATAKILGAHSLKLTGNKISVQGFRRSQLLHDIADGCDWVNLERKYGASMVRTACYDFVRRFSPKVISDNL